MADAPLKTIAGESRGTVGLADDLFGIRPNEHVVYETVKAYLANQRQGNACTKTRSEVRGGRRKPWKQKGTGRARAGANNSPVWVRGGRAHGPKPRDYRMEIPKKIRRLALRSALSDRASTGHVVVVEALALAEAKTRAVAAFLKANGLDGQSCLVVVSSYDESVHRAARNIPRVTVRVWDELNAHDVVRSEWFLITKDALAAMQEGAAR
jgi:large subunit ribosomal protein L4